MAKLMKLVIMGLISTVAFGTPLSVKYNEQIKRERENIAREIQNFRGNKYTEHKDIILTGTSNEGMLMEIGSINEKLRIRELHLIFPDVNYLDKYLDNVSRNVSYVVVYLLDEKSDEEGLEYRDVESFLELGLEKRFENLPNVAVWSIKVDKKDLKKIIPNSFNTSVLEDEIVKKYILR